MTHPQLHILGVRVDDISLEETMEKLDQDLVAREDKVSSCFITTPNPEICLHAIQDEHYRRHILDRAFLALPDGFGLKIAARIFGERLRNRVTGVDFTYALMERAAENGWRVFLFGGEGNVAERCGKILMEKYKGLNVVGTMSGEIFNFQFSIFSKFSKDQFLKSKQQNISPPYEGGEQGEVIESINQTKPDILFVALGAPKQEYWIAENLPSLPSVKLAIGVGGTFDFIAGRVKRAPRVMRQFGLEWLWRFIMQPWRLPRIYNATLKFMFTVLQWRLRMAFVYRRNVVGLIIRNGGCSLAGKMSASQAEDRRFKSGHPLQILLVERTDEPGHFQLPQGGIDRAETPDHAILREMQEELGTDKLKIIKHISHFYRYKWPKIDQLRKGYKGQKQDLFILEFSGSDSDIRIDNREHSNYQWVPLEKAVESVHEIRREQVEKAVASIREP